MWRGRWRSESTLKYYLQEALSDTFGRNLPSETQKRVLLFANMFDRVIALYA